MNRPEDPGKLPEIDTSNLIARPQASRDTDPETLKRRAAAVLLALLMFCLILTALISPARTPGKAKLFAERPPQPAADANAIADHGPWLAHLLALTPWGVGPGETAASASLAGGGAATAAAASAGAPTRARDAAVKTAAPFAAPKLAGGGLPGLSSLGGSSSGASAPAARNDGVFRGDGGTGLVVDDLKHPGGRAAWRGGPKLSAEELKGMSATQADALQTTHANGFVLIPIPPGGGSGDRGEPSEAGKGQGTRALGDSKGEPALKDAAKPSMAQHQPSMPSMAPPGGKPGQNCQALSAVTGAPPPNAAAANQTYTQDGTSLCRSNQDLAQHQQLRNGDSDSADATQCAATCSKGTQAAPASAAPASAAPTAANGGAGTTNQSDQADSRKGYAQLQKEADQKLQDTAKKAQQDCVDPNNQAAQAIGQLDPSPAASILDQAAAIPDIAGNAAAMQNEAQAQALTTANGWRSTVSQAQNIQRQASAACQRLPSQLQPVADLQRQVASKLRQDRTALNRADQERRAASEPDFAQVSANTSQTLSSYSQEYQAAVRDYQASKKRLDDFRNAVTDGAIKRQNDDVARLVADAQTGVGNAQSAIGQAVPGQSASFSAASQQVSAAMGPLLKRDTGYSAALDAARAAQQTNSGD